MDDKIEERTSSETSPIEGGPSYRRTDLYQEQPYRRISPGINQDPDLSVCLKEEGLWYRRSLVEQSTVSVAPTEEEHQESDTTVSSQSCQTSCTDWFHSNAFLIYCSQALSSWGDRMWTFVIALYLVHIEDGLLRLTSIFGLSKTMFVLVFGALVGEWVDRTPRLRATRLSLVIQNSSIIVCAGLLLFFLLCDSWLKDNFGGILVGITLAAIIAAGCIADVASLALKICIQKDWVVVIANGDKARLTEMNSVIRRIDLLTNITAPILVGNMATYLSLEILAMFLVCWNLVSMFIEYFQLRRVYMAVPELAVKLTKTHEDDEDSVNIAEEYQPMNVIDNQELNMQDEGTDTQNMQDEGTDTQNMQQDNLMVEKKEREKKVRKKKGIHWRILGWIKSTYNGFKIYNSYQVAWAGLSLSFLYMTVLGFDSVSIGYGYSQGVSGFVLGIFLGLGSLMGILGTLIFPKVRQRIGLERTGLYANFEQIMCLSLCVASVYAPGSAFDLSYRTDVTSTTSAPVYTTNYYNETVTSDIIDVEHSYWSVGLLFAGMILSRTGLWMFDLTVTQLLQENIRENERGVVNGIQSSLNCFMDMLHFMIVIIAPHPESFGLLVFISVIFVCMGGMLYSMYVYKVRGHLFHPEKFMPCKAVNENGTENSPPA